MRMPAGSHAAQPAPAEEALTSSDRRYEPFAPSIPLQRARSAASFPWRGWSVHLETIGDPAAPVRILLIRGAGGNAAAMWPFAAHLASSGAAVTVVDLPGYGRTKPVQPQSPSYQQWQELLVELVDQLHDARPLILMGASMGGMLALDAAHESGKSAHVIVTCLLDLSDQLVRKHALRMRWMGNASKLLRLVPRFLRGLPLPLRWLTPMHRISNDPDLAAAVLADRRGGGSSMPLGWYVDAVQAGPAVAAEEYEGPPVLLLHPGDDRWTPMEFSVNYLNRLPVEVRFTELPGAGHFPVEEPGFQVLLDEVRDVVRALRPVRP